MDAVIFVFSLENEASFNAIYSYYTKMAHFRNSAEIPLILVGTQGETNEFVFMSAALVLVRTVTTKRSVFVPRGVAWRGVA